VVGYDVEEVVVEAGEGGGEGGGGREEEEGRATHSDRARSPPFHCTKYSVVLVLTHNSKRQ